MRWLLILGLLMNCLLISETALGTTHDVPEDIDDPGPNIPTVGSSLFDKVYSKKNKRGEVVYDVPQSLRPLLDRVEIQGSSVAYSFFPFSRSLQRPRDLSFDPLLNPRLVMATDFSSINGPVNPVFPAHMFFGYSKPADQLEVISYNHEAGRYEFQIVKDFSTHPKVYYVDRAKCLSCHQNQAAILSKADWPDSARGIAGDLVLRKLGLRRGEFDEGITQATQMIFGGTWGFPGVSSVDIASNFSNEFARDQRIWLYGCQGDRMCRLGILLRNLASGTQNGEAQKAIQYAEQLLEPKPIRYYRDAFTTEDFEYKLNAISSPYGEYPDAVNDPKALLAMIDLIYNLNPEENPSSPRAEVFPRQTPHFQEFSLHRDLIQGLPSEQIAETLLKFYRKGSPIFDERPLNTLEVMSLLLADMGVPKAKFYSSWLKKETPKKILFEGPIPPFFKDNALNLFSRHCSQCHASNTAYPPQFLFGTETEVKAQIKSLKNSMLLKLENDLMPPSPSARELLKASGDREHLLQYLHGI